VPAKQADKWVTLTFRAVENGVNRDATVTLNCHRLESPFEDLSETVAEILATAITTQTPYTIIKAEVHSETVTTFNF
jgi:tRNA U34 5-methylaminomethyl-2-thiouridine-forming methyltransferase MnmC